MKSKLEQVLNSPILGYACHRIVLDDQGRPCDYEFLEVNETFEKLTGLRQEQVIGRTVRQVLPGIEQAEFDWIGCYGAVALGGGDKEFEQYCGPLKKWYRVQVSSPERLFFTTLFADITESKQAEEALQTQRNRLAGILEGTRAGTWEWNVQTGETVFNERWAEIIGYTLDEISPVSIATWQKFAHPDDLKKSGDLLEKHFSGELDYYECESRMRHKNGQWVWVLDRGQVISRTADGKPLLMLGTHQDINERKITEEKLLHSERTYREIFDSITDALFIHDINTGAILDVNDTMLAMFGYTRKEMQGVTVADLSPLVEPYTNEHAGDLIKRAAAGETVVFQWLNRRKNGELFYSENILKFVTIAGAQRIMAIVRDITERKQAEEALQESEAKLSALFAAMTEMVVLHEVVFDLAGTPVNYRITDCNAAYTRITGIRREEAVGKLANEVYGTSEPPYLAEFARVSITGEPYHYETYFPPMDKHFSISVVSPGKNQFATITTDITETKRIQAVIAAKNKELEQLVYVASHDLRSPLVNVDGFSRELDFSLKELVTMLEDGRDQSQLVKKLRAELPDMEKTISRIRTSARQMDELLKGLLKLSRSGRSALQIRNIDMNDLVAGLVASFAFRLQEAGIELEVDSLPACRGDAVQLTQVFSNLLDNAVKFSDPGRPGRIWIRGAMETGRAVYRVEDNGIGIAENHLDRVFELFHRLDPGKTAGEGLGLTIARQALGRMDGEITVESKPGQGSVFMVILPPARKGDNQ